MAENLQEIENLDAELQSAIDGAASALEADGGIPAAMARDGQLRVAVRGEPLQRRDGAGRHRLRHRRGHREGPCAGPRRLEVRRRHSAQPVPRRKRRLHALRRRPGAGGDGDRGRRLGRDPALPGESPPRRVLADAGEGVRDQRSGQGSAERQGEGRLHRGHRRHPRLPARFPRGHPPAARNRPPRRPPPGLQGHQAGSTPQQRRRLPSRGARRREQRRTRSPARLHAGGAADEGRGEEPHRLRRLRRPRRRGRPAAHHRHGVAAGAASERNRQRGRRRAGEDPPLRPREEPRLAGHEANSATIRG